MANHNKNRLLLSILAILEKKLSISKVKLQIKLLEIYKLEYSEKQIKRTIEELKQMGCIIIFKKRELSLKKESNYYIALMKLFNEIIINSSEFNSISYGIINPKKIARQLVESIEPNINLANFLLDISNAISKSKEIQFNYIPQTDETAIKWEKRKKNISGSLRKDSSTIPVTMIPKYLVFSNHNLLLLGESFFQKNRHIRQYDIVGIKDIKYNDPSQSKLEINPHKIYQDSFKTWFGGKKYHLIIEDLSFRNKSKLPKQKSLKVNGEHEIISYVLSSVGEKKIINPPQELIDYAKKKDIPEKLIFRFKEL